MEESRIEELEIKVSYLERYLDELNAVVIEQGRIISRLEDKIAELTDEIAGEIRPNEKPPHY